MAGSYHGQVHEENLKRLEEFHQVSKKNRKIYSRFDRIAACSEGCKMSLLRCFPEL